MIDHAILPPSGAPLWGVCSASVVSQRGDPDFETPQQAAGTAGHWVGAECLENWRSPGVSSLFCSDWVGSVAPNGVVIDEKTAEGAQVYVDDVLAVAQEHGALQDMLVEHRVRMPQIHAENWGTLDLGLSVLRANRVYVWDYKSGHRPVAARGNLQLIDYLAGLMNEFNLSPSVEFVIRVVQPFAYRANGPVSEWSGTLAELQPYFNQLARKATEALTQPTMTAGAHCRDCSAVGRCAEGRKHMYAFADYVDNPYVIDMMSGADLAAEREILRGALAVGKSRLEAVEDELAHRVKNGDTGSGLTVESQQSSRWYWAIPIPQAVTLCAQFGADISTPGALTPKQALALVDPGLKGAFTKTLRAVIKPPTTSLKLVPAGESLTARAFKPKRT